MGVWDSGGGGEGVGGEPNGTSLCRRQRARFASTDCEGLLHRERIEAKPLSREKKSDKKKEPNLKFQTNLN